VADWWGSSFDLLNRVEVLDHTDSIPDELFDRVLSDPVGVGRSGGSSRGWLSDSASRRSPTANRIALIDYGLIENNGDSDDRHRSRNRRPV